MDALERANVPHELDVARVACLRDLWDLAVRPVIVEHPPVLKGSENQASVSQCEEKVRAEVERLVGGDDF